MVKSTLGPLDPAVLAEEVRDLAHDAHRYLKADPPEKPNAVELSRRLATLQHQIRGYPFEDLACWLENVQQLIVEQ